MEHASESVCLGLQFSLVLQLQHAEAAVVHVFLLFLPISVTAIHFSQQSESLADIVWQLANKSSMMILFIHEIFSM